MLELRKYQTDIKNSVLKSFRYGNKRVCVVLGCGGGKSVIMSAIAKSAADKGKVVLTTAHRLELISQLKKTYESFGVNMDLCGIGMIQTIVRNIDGIRKPDLIICDEFHHYLSMTYRKLFEKFPDVYVIGFTATPVRLDGKGLKDICDDLVLSVSVKWLIENSFLAPYKLFSNPLADFDDLKVIGGEYRVGGLMDKPKIYGDTVENYRRIADGKKAIVYCSSVESSKQTAAEFQANGYKAASLDGAANKKLREQTIRDFRDGKVLILCNCELFGEGLDIPDCECVIMLRKTKSLTLYIQQAMRAMRYNPGKTAYIIDHVLNYEEHGLPDDDREWSLEDRKSKKGQNKAVLKNCPICLSVAVLSARKCPECGFEFIPEEVKEKEKVEAELIEIDATEAKIRRFKKARYSQYKECRDWNELCLFAEVKGWKPYAKIFKAVELGFENQMPPELRKKVWWVKKKLKEQANKEDNKGERVRLQRI